jgi:hypothetical protein
MTNTAVDRTYGGFRRPTSPGLWTLGTVGTGIMFAGLIVTIIALAVGGFAISCVFAFLTVVVTLPLLYRTTDGRNGIQLLTARTAWGRGKLAGANLYRSGPLAQHGFGTCALPGLASKIEALEAYDARGQEFGLLCNPSRGHASIVLVALPDSSSLVDVDVIDQQVGHWGGWLANLAYEPDLVAAQVLIEAAPDSGIRLRREVHGQLVNDAPALARQVLQEVVEGYPAGSAAISSYLSLTWSTAARPGRKKRSIAETALEIAQRLPGLMLGLAATGAGPVRPMTVAEIAASVRVAYDPAVHAQVDELGGAGAGIEWEECGPVGAEERRGEYLHDSGTSVTWSMSAPPRGHVFSSVLGRLLAPHPDIARKRVSVTYRPHKPAIAARVVENDRKTAIFRAQSRKVGRAADEVDVIDAKKAADDEARGSGVVRFGLLVTATVLDPAELPAAVAAVESLAGSSRLRLRRMWGSQSAGFQANLPLGMSLPSHLKVPGPIRDAL